MHKQYQKCKAPWDPLPHSAPLPSLKASTLDPLTTLSAQVDMADQRLHVFIAGSATTYTAIICDRCYHTLQTNQNAESILKASIEEVKNLLAPVKGLLNDILQLDGVGSVYQKADKVVRRFKEVVNFLEDIHCALLLGSAHFLETRDEQGFLYQRIG